MPDPSYLTDTLEYEGLLAATFDITSRTQGRSLPPSGLLPSAVYPNWRSRMLKDESKPAYIRWALVTYSKPDIIL